MLLVCFLGWLDVSFLSICFRFNEPIVGILNINFLGKKIGKQKRVLIKTIYRFAMHGKT